MGDTTISITDEQKDQLDEIKDHPKEPYKDTIDRLMETYESAHEDPMATDTELTATVKPEVDEDALDDVVDRVESAVSEAGIDESEIARQVTDDLVSQLPPRIAEELQQ